MKQCSGVVLMALGGLAATLACAGEPLAPAASTVTAGQLAAAVTGTVADSIDAAGQFVLADRMRDDGTEITEQRARELAIAYWKTIEQELRIRAKRDRYGVPLSARLRICSRAFYAESGYDSLPTDLPVEMRRGLGPQWLLGLCNGDNQELAISVSSEATDLSVRADGTISILKNGDFWDVGVPVGVRIPAWPENAAVAAAAPGYRVSGVPVLRRRARNQVMFIADWYFPIEQEGEIRGLVSGVSRRVSALQFGIYSSFSDVKVLDAHPDFADESRVEVARVSLGGGNVRLVPITRRADVAFWIEPVVRVVP